MNKQALETLWVSSGGSHTSADVASAIALAESSGQTTQISQPNTDGSRDHGLWQINDKAHPEYNVTLLLNPTYNARAAIAISNSGTNWQPWTTYNTGAYKKYLGSQGKDSGFISNTIDTILGGPTSDTQNAYGTVKSAVGGAGSTITDVGKAIGFVFSASGMDRILKVVGGGIMVLIAINELIKSTGTPSLARVPTSLSKATV